MAYINNLDYPIYIAVHAARSCIAVHQVIVSELVVRSRDLQCLSPRTLMRRAIARLGHEVIAPATPEKAAR